MSKSVVVLAVVLLTTACSGQQSISQFAACSSLACMQKQAREEIVQQCNEDLFRYPRYSRQRQNVINTTYRYPLTNWDMFSDSLSLGLNGPSPMEWCRMYADQRLQTRYRSR